MKPVKIFVSYSHQYSDWVDEDGKFKLVPWLSRQLRRENVVFWTDKALDDHIGEDFRKNIKNNIEDADIALLLVSQEFASSDFILEFELPLIKEEYQNRSLKIVPLLIDGLGKNGRRNIPWIFELQTIPNESKPIINYTENAVEWSNVRIKILDALLDKIDAVKNDKKKEKERSDFSKEGGVMGVTLSNDSFEIKKIEGNNLSSEQEHIINKLKELTEKNKQLEDELKKQEQTQTQNANIKPTPDVKNALKTEHKSSKFTETVNGVSFDMIAVQGGTFMMGSPETERERLSVEGQHNVTLSSYYIGKFVVTQELWKAVMGNNNSYFKGFNLPIENVSWDDCQQFIHKLNQLTSKKYSLPTEAQWEYAARGGIMSNGYIFAGSNNLNDIAWHLGNSGGKTNTVGQKNPNELGLYDMCGNVWEWCLDWYESYSDDFQINPIGPSYGSMRVFRGGSWFNLSDNCRVAYRNSVIPNYKYYYLGLRLVLPIFKS